MFKCGCVFSVGVGVWIWAWGVGLGVAVGTAMAMVVALGAENLGWELTEVELGGPNFLAPSWPHPLVPTVDNSTVEVR